MKLDSRVVAEKNAIPGAEYMGPMCSYCGSRRTERILGLTRECKVCGLRGEVRVTPRGCFVEAVK